MSFYMVAAIKANSTLIPYETANISPELEKALLNSDNRQGFSFRGINTAAPVVKFASPAVGSCLAISGLAGVVLTAFEVYLIKHGAVATGSGSVHRKLSCTAAVMQLENIATGKGVAKANYAIHAVDDGTNEVWTLEDNVALPTTARVTDVWYQGPLYIGSTLYQVEESQFSPTQEVLKRHSNGQVGPGFVGLKPATPALTVKNGDGVLHGLAGAFGKNVDDVTMFYRKGSEGDGLRVPDETETHISLVMASALLTSDAIEGSPRTEIDFGVTFDGGDDGTNAIVTLDTTAAIAEPA